MASTDKHPSAGDLPPPYSPSSGAPPVGFVPAPYPPTHQHPRQQTVYMQPALGSSSVHVVQQPGTTYLVQPQPTVLVTSGNCPACRSGILTNEFTCCGIFMGILFFPIGLICCFLMMQQRCTNCRAVYG